MKKENYFIGNFTIFDSQRTKAIDFCFKKLLFQSGRCDGAALQLDEVLYILILPLVRSFVVRGKNEKPRVFLTNRERKNYRRVFSMPTKDKKNLSDKGREREREIFYLLKFFIQFHTF